TKLGVLGVLTIIFMACSNEKGFEDKTSEQIIDEALAFGLVDNDQLVREMLICEATKQICAATSALATARCENSAGREYATCLDNAPWIPSLPYLRACR